jgi:putative DNA primase/helicase
MNEFSPQCIKPHGVPISFQPEGRTTNARVAWRDLLICSKRSGAPKPILANAITALRLAPDWEGVLAYNEFSLHTVTKKSAPWQGTPGGNWADYDDARACEWLQHQGILVNSKVAGEAIQTVAMEGSFHPVQDYLNNLRWDGLKRLDHWLSTYLGATDGPFVRAAGSRWLISAVARILRPGCQADYTLLLEGPQGVRKSSGLRILAGDDWFADHISDLGSKDSRIELHGKWILEMAELDKVRRGNLERVKAFLTARTDHFRLPYGRRAQDVPRSCVFAATVNDTTPLTDETGNRRFWPVTCGEILIDALTRDRDQLWGEAYQEYKNGAIWWLDSVELNTAAAAEQAERYEAGVWDEVILTWLDDPTQREEHDGHNNLPVLPFDSTRQCVTITDVLIHAVGKSIDRCTQADRNQVVRCLVHAGWQRKQERSGPMRGKWFYIRPTGTGVEQGAEPDANG